MTAAWLVRGESLELRPDAIASREREHRDARIAREKLGDLRGRVQGVHGASREVELERHLGEREASAR